MEDESRLQGSESIDEENLKKFSEIFTNLLNYAKALYFGDRNKASQEEDEMLQRLAKLKEEVELLIKNRDIQKLKEYTISQLQKEPLSIGILLAMYKMNSHIQLVNMDKFLENEGDENCCIFLFSDKEIRLYLDEYKNKFIYSNPNHKLVAKEKAMLTALIAKFMDRSEEIVNLLMNLLAQLKEVPNKYLDVIATLLCTNDYSVRLEVYNGIQNLYNQGLIDDRDLDLLYSKYINEKCDS